MEKPKLRHITVKFKNIKDKNKTLKASGEKQIVHKRIRIRLTLVFLKDTGDKENNEVIYSK